MRSKIIAKAYLCGHGSQLYVPTTPGRGLKFVGGVAVITDERDMPHAMKLPEHCIVEVEHDYEPWLAGWREKAGNATARVNVINAPEPTRLPRGRVTRDLPVEA